MEQSLTPWLMPALALIVGIVIGFIIARTVPSAAPSRTQRDLDELKERFDSYQSEVVTHFNSTAALVKKLTQSYQDVQDHLTEGANRLALESAETVFGVQLKTFEKNIDATTAFFGGLKNQVHRAIKIALLGQATCGSQQHRGVTIVAAGVHLPLVFRVMRKLIQLAQRQRIHVGTQADHPWRGTGTQHTDDTGLGDAAMHLQDRKSVV